MGMERDAEKTQVSGQKRRKGEGDWEGRKGGRGWCQRLRTDRRRKQARGVPLGQREQREVELGG